MKNVKLTARAVRKIALTRRSTHLTNIHYLRVIFLKSLVISKMLFEEVLVPLFFGIIEILRESANVETFVMLLGIVKQALGFLWRDFKSFVMVFAESVRIPVTGFAKDHLKLVKTFRFWKTIVLITIFYVVTEWLNKRKKWFNKYPKGTAPGPFWRVFGVLLYFPQILDFNATHGHMLFIKPSMACGFLIPAIYSYRLKMVWRWFEVFDGRVFRNRLSILQLIGMSYQKVLRTCTRRIHPRIFKLPMYARYHMTNASILSFMMSIIQRFYFFVLRNTARPGDYFKRRPGGNVIFYGNQTEANLHALMTAVFLLSYSKALFDAAMGHSFTETPLKRMIFGHLSSNDKYPDENWEDVGFNR
uniref:hypothetical protein n=1 Tax=Haramonas pauciplastida TaxID=478668 RepID=UPI0021150B49|nr:hypothetical protein NQY21_pgp048 [Haramonas pauciplastida]YP_010444176.1 hypothetical protein NQY21_pgp022 [Haramonas pauciplastida]UTE95036.1 hypothetical protein HaraPt_p127 [Haramonas pauciplastida]UTE95062.1 hypothetical protein HaraPt_p153 [Haramonas pauciplastida]